MYDLRSEGERAHPSETRRSRDTRTQGSPCLVLRQPATPEAQLSTNQIMPFMYRQHV